MSWQRYKELVMSNYPRASEREVRVRCGILYMRDVASREGPGAEWELQPIMSAIESMGCAYGLACRPLAQLETVRETMGRLMNTSSHFRSAFEPQAETETPIRKAA